MTASDPLESDSLGLRFDSPYDALDYARKIVDDTAHWPSLNKLNVADRYMRGEAEIRVNFTAGPDANEFCLVFLRIPERVHEHGAVLGLHPDVVDAAAKGCDGANGRMFVGVTEFVECPQQIVPTFVWLERANEINDLFRQVFNTSLHSVLKMRFVGRDGEKSVLDGGDSVNSLVERGAEAVDNIKDNALQSGWHGLNELDFHNLVAGLRVMLNDTSVWLTVDERISLPSKVKDVILSPCDAEL